MTNKELLLNGIDFNVKKQIASFRYDSKTGYIIKMNSKYNQELINVRIFGDVHFIVYTWFFGKQVLVKIRYSSLIFKEKTS